LQIKEQSAEQALRLLADYLSVENDHRGRQMEAVEVYARLGAQGALVPTNFTWQGQIYAVESSGRRWQDEAGEHILVMTEGKTVYELVHAPEEKRWYLKPIGPEGRFA